MFICSSLVIIFVSEMVSLITHIFHNNELYIIVADYHGKHHLCPNFKIPGLRTLITEDFKTIDLGMSEIKNKLLKNIPELIVGTRQFVPRELYASYKYDFISHDDRKSYYITKVPKNSKIYYKTDLIESKSYFCLRISYRIAETSDWKDFIKLTDKQFGIISYREKTYPHFTEGYYIKKPFNSLIDWLNSPKQVVELIFEDSLMRR